MKLFQNINFNNARLGATALGLLWAMTATAQTQMEREQIVRSYDKTQSEALQQSIATKYGQKSQEMLQYAQQNNIPVRKQLNNGTYAELQRIAADGTPIYYATSNAGCAKTTRANALNTGGVLGLTVNGQNMSLAVWDGGPMRTSHTAFGGRVTQGDGVTFTTADDNNGHANHVAGTMVASLTANNGYSRGMAYAANLVGYDWNNDVTEATTAAANGLLVSNHSYGYGVVDYNGVLQIPKHWVGKYDETAADWDAIMYNYPYYQQVNAAGNDREYQATITNKGGYDLLTGHSCAKNAIVVAAVYEVANYTSASSVTMSSFSNWGPTDDGRIKPDISAKGVDVNSTYSNSNSAYATLSGTSMASPNATGTLGLIQQHYKNVKSSYMYASMLRGLVLHTADEAGSAAGPDYKFGWGLMNAKRAAEVITASTGSTAILSSQVLSNGGSYTITVTAPGSQNLEATICWTDPAGNAITNSTIDDATRALKNDLDIRITRSGTTYMPWILNPASPATAATTGDNIRDNVEKIFISAAASGVYTITVTHKGTLVGSNQRFSLVVTGIGSSGGTTPPPASYCAANGTNASYEWIGNVQTGSFSNASTQAQSAAGYTNYTNLTISMPTGANTITLTPGFASTAYTERWSIWVDFNKDNDFADAGEQIYTNTTGSTAAIAAAVTIPSTAAGVTTRMRVLMSDNATMANCGTFAYGEVEDYTVTFTAPAPPPSGYCTSNATNASYEWISKVQLGTFSNSSTQAQSAAGYTNYTSLSANMTTGANTVILTPGFSGSAYTEYWAIWIDFNNDNDFADAGEQVLNYTTGSNAAVTTSVTIPSTAAGTTRRMRVVMRDNATMTACGTFTYGEVEDYSVTFTTGGSSGSGAPTGYCASKGNSVTDEWIDLVEFGGMSNASGANAGYGNFTNKTGTLAKGSTTAFKFSAGFASTAYTEFWAIWIDFNRDGDFLDAGEQVVSTSSSSSGTLSANVTIPTSASLGLTRVRVSMKYKAAQTACETFSYGEVEDYLLNITGTSLGGSVILSQNDDSDVEWVSNHNFDASMAAPDVVLFPNPTAGDITVSFDRFTEAMVYTIYTADGKAVDMGTINDQRAVIATSHLPAGAYYIRMTNSIANHTQPFIKQD